MRMRSPGLLLALLVVCAATAWGQDTPGDWASYEAPIVNGLVSSSFPSTGALLYGTTAANAQHLCSGTLIGCETFITAAHCVCDTNGVNCLSAGAPKPALYYVFLQNAGIFTVSSIALRSDFDFPVGDVAVLKLGSPVQGIRPSRINTTARPSAGMDGIIAGFGRTGGFNYDYGVLHSGHVETASCLNGVSNQTSVCWSYKAPVGAPGTDSNTCNGDSGGPLFLDFGDGPVLAGTTSGGESDDCLPTDDSYDANVYEYRDWIQAYGGADLANTACGNLPQVGDPGAAVDSQYGTLNAGMSAESSFFVPSGTTLLRITLSAVSDFDLYVRAGSPATPAFADCQQAGAGPYSACEFSYPTPGNWYVLVDAYSGGGGYQLTTTRFGMDCQDPANDNLACNDGNACTTDDRCRSGMCSGIAVADGTSCDDGDLCTNPDRCVSGACASGQSPRTDCRGPYVPTAGTLRLRTPLSQVDTLSWRWVKGQLTGKADYGNPTLNTPVALCVYDQTSDSDALVLRQYVAPGGMCGTRKCWSETLHRYRYSNRRAPAGGITHIDLRDGVDGKAQISVRGRGDGLQMPALPLHQDHAVTVQLTTGSACWEARYQSNERNDQIEFRAHPGQ